MKARSLALKLRGGLLRGDSVFCSVCHHSYRKFLAAGVDRRPDALCPGCGSLERHRLLVAMLDQFWREARLSDSGRLLHVAPETAIAAALDTHFSCISIDRDPKRGSIAMDITALAFPDSFFDAVLCMHVLEHVHDDGLAMGELFRVMKPGGWGIIQVPIKGDVTVEDLTITDPLERQRLYGQSDHVRQYGRDFSERLKTSGFLVETFRKTDVFEPAFLDRLSVACEDEIILSRRPR